MDNNEFYSFYCLLIEKLNFFFRSCPKIGILYMLMRAKKGKTPEERFKEHFDDVVSK